MELQTLVPPPCRRASHSGSHEFLFDGTDSHDAYAVHSHGQVAIVKPCSLWNSVTVGLSFPIVSPFNSVDVE